MRAIIAENAEIAGSRKSLGHRQMAKSVTALARRTAGLTAAGAPRILVVPCG